MATANCVVCRPPKAYVAVDLYMEEMLDDEQDAEADIAAAAAAAVNADAVEASADIEQDTAYGSILQSHNAGAVQVSVGVACKAAIQSQVCSREPILHHDIGVNASTWWY